MGRSEPTLRRKRLAELIASKREKMGLSQEAFGEWIGQNIGKAISFAAVQRWENPHDPHMPRVENLRAIALAFGLTMDELNTYLDAKI